MRLRPVEERDQAIRDHIETTHWIDPKTGQLYASPERDDLLDPAQVGRDTTQGGHDDEHRP